MTNQPTTSGRTNERTSIDPNEEKVEKAQDPTEYLGAEEIAEIREVFMLFDKDGDGNIPTKELAVALKNLGQNPTEAELLDLINEVDVDKNGMIDFDEFCAMMRDIIKDPDNDDDIKATFQVFDYDGKGFIVANDIKVVMENLGEKMNDEEYDDMIHAADVDKDGYVTYDDFYNMMTKKQLEYTKSQEEMIIDVDKKNKKKQI